MEQDRILPHIPTFAERRDNLTGNIHTARALGHWIVRYPQMCPQGISNHSGLQQGGCWTCCTPALAAIPAPRLLENHKIKSKQNTFYGYGTVECPSRMPVGLSFSVSLSFCFSSGPFPRVCLLVYLSVYLPACPSISLSTSLSRLCVSVCVSGVSLALSLSLSLSLTYVYIYIYKCMDM